MRFGCAFLCACCFFAFGASNAAVTTTTYCVVARCNTGYYADENVPDVGNTACTRCPNYFGSLVSGGPMISMPGMSNGATADSITDCYIPAGRYFADNSGKGQYVGNCYYSSNSIIN